MWGRTTWSLSTHLEAMAMESSHLAMSRNLHSRLREFVSPTQDMKNGRYSLNSLEGLYNLYINYKPIIWLPIRNYI